MATLIVKNLIVLATLFVAMSACQSKTETPEVAREKMVKYQLIQRGIVDAQVLYAFSTVPREEFVLPEYKTRAYEDAEVPIAFGETLDRAYENAVMLEALDIQPTDTVLEVGTGSGYLSALISKIAQKVYSIEIDTKLAQEAISNHANIGIKNVEVKTGDGFLGWPEVSPFQKIVMTCSPEKIPEPLIAQLTEGGRLIAPIGGDEKFQMLTLFTKKNGKLVEMKKLSPTTFTPMRGISKAK